MKQTRSNHLFVGLSALAFAGALFAAPAMAKPKTEHVRGTISSVTDSGFTVNTGDGSRQVTLSSETTIAGVVPSSLDEIKAGTFIGTANVEKNGNNRALEMVVFPDSMKGVGLGDYPWDLSPSDVKSGDSSGMAMGDGSSMTNGTVSAEKSGSGDSMSQEGSSMTNGTVSSTGSGDEMSSEGSSMTNGTVTKSSGSSQMSLKVDYGEGSKTITVPSDVPVVALQEGSKSDIKKGAHVFVAGPDGSDPFQAKLVLVGIDGTVPPM